MNEITPIETPEGRPARVRKPDWIRVKAPTSKGFNETRKLMRENHPDTLAARGVPQEFVQRATEKVAEINAAWDRIKRDRGL